MTTTNQPVQLALSDAAIENDVTVLRAVYPNGIGAEQYAEAVRTLRLGAKIAESLRGSASAPTSAPAKRAKRTAKADDGASNLGISPTAAELLEILKKAGKPMDTAELAAASGKQGPFITTLMKNAAAQDPKLKIEKDGRKNVYSYEA